MDLHDEPDQVPVGRADRHHLDRHPQRHRRRGRVLGAARALAARDASRSQPRAAEITATALVVVIITFLTIIFGELVPKRLGQMYPETVARFVARPMDWLSADRAAVRASCCRGAPRRMLRLLGIRGDAGAQR